MNFSNALSEYAKTQDGTSLADLSERAPVLVVFLRHGGCTFCREALADIQRERESIERSGARIVLVHMMTENEAAQLFEKYQLADVSRISDPERLLYRAFGLESGRLGQLLAPKVWWRGFIAGFLKRNGGGRLQGDGRQMPGVFVVKQRRIIEAYRHHTAADRPDYSGLAACGVAPSE